MMPDKSIVFVVDDDRSVREAVVNLLRSVEQKVRCFGSAQEFLRYRRPDCPTCLLLDVRLPGISGLALQHELVASGEPIPIIFMTAYGDVPMAVDAIKTGAEGFLVKPCREQDLLDGVRRALERDRVARTDRAALVALRQRRERLTLREREVMDRLVQGKLNKQIAAELGKSVVTIKVHRRHVMGKMGAVSLTDLVRMADRLAESA